MLQLVYLNFTSPRFDENDLNTMKKMYSSYFANIESNPDYIAQREYMKTLYGDNPRRQLTSRAQIEALQLDDMPAVYHKLYDNAKNFRFTFVGNVDLDELRPLVEKYIGSLPVKGAELDVVDDGVRAVKGVVTNDFKQEMQQPKVSVMLSYTGQIDYTPREPYGHDAALAGSRLALLAVDPRGEGRNLRRAGQRLCRKGSYRGIRHAH